MTVGSSGPAAGAALVLVAGALLLAAPHTAGPLLPLPVAEQPASHAPGAPVAERVVSRTAAVEYEWPTGQEVMVLHPFVRPAERWSAGHRGVDLSLPQGGAVRAAADGVVAFAGAVAGRGVVSIDHADGIRTTYEPLSADVRRGEPVHGGQLIGHLDGVGHCAPEPCLHWGARRGQDDYLDPLSLLGQQVVIRLLPAHGH